MSPFCILTFLGWWLSDDCDAELFNATASSSRGVNLTAYNAYMHALLMSL